MGLGRPFWVDDVDFDLDRHLHRAQVVEPRDDRALADLIGDIASVPLARDRPLWEAWVVEGLADGRVGLLAKIHHAGIDGATALNVMSQIFDTRPERSKSSFSTPAWRPERPPGVLFLTGTGLATVVRTPFGLMRLVPPTLVCMGSMAWRGRRPEDRRRSATCSAHHERRSTPP